MIVRQLFLIRHGDYGGYNLRLNESGQSQMKRATDSIKKYLKFSSSSVHFISSHLRRAIDSALLVSDELDCGRTFYIDTNLEGMMKDDSDDFYNHLEKIYSQAVIAIGHRDFLRNFPDFLKHKKGWEDFCRGESGKGEGYYFDLGKKEAVKIP